MLNLQWSLAAAGNAQPHPWESVRPPESESQLSEVVRIGTMSWCLLGRDHREPHMGSGN